jgi:hypothetical protein
MSSDTTGMESRDRGPLYSTRADEPEAASLLDHFVLGLAERIDMLQDADAAHELGALIRGAAMLAQEAEQAGHAVLAAVAVRLADVARQGKAEDAHSELVELTDVAQRVRRGHRGSL